MIQWCKLTSDGGLREYGVIDMKSKSWICRKEAYARFEDALKQFACGPLMRSVSWYRFGAGGENEDTVVTSKDTTANMFSTSLLELSLVGLRVNSSE